MLGRTSEGVEFEVPRTRSVLHGLIGSKKTLFDTVVLGSLVAQVLLWCCLPISVSKYFFLVTFAFWRLAYNAGLGFLLIKQSEDKWIVRAVKSHGLLEGQDSWLVKELAAKNPNYKELPLEVNVWLLFRQLVDLILLNDFVSYCCFAWSWLQFPASQSMATHVLRWVCGWTLIALNVAVKVDAHRVVTDLAWYWSDAFFMSMQELVFDGVFEMAPHPMYSVGYAGYYGLSLVTGSYTVFFVSLAAHMCQFLFLALFETPRLLFLIVYHFQMVRSWRPTLSLDIERTYGERKYLGRQRTGSIKPTDGAEQTTTSSSSDTTASTLYDLHNFYFFKETILLRNLDCFRSRDFAMLVSLGYTAAFSLCCTRSKANSAWFVVLPIFQALVWRTFHSAGLGLLLYKQSRSKWFVRHFIKNYVYKSQSTPGNTEVVKEAFSNWATLYNFSLMSTYLSFALMAWHCRVPFDFSNTGRELLRHTCGLLLISLHVWTARETYEVLGSFGWLYGDFFIEDYPKALYYTGIYRYLNNPERIMGGAAFLGMSLLSGSRTVWAVAIYSIVAHLLFLQLVENPHMALLYGRNVRKQSGVSKGIGRVATFQSRLPFFEKLSIITQEPLEACGHFCDEAKKTIVAQSKVLLSWLKVLVNKYIQPVSQKRLAFVRVADVANLDTSAYSLKLVSDKTRFHLGEPIAFEWTSSPSHSRADWIGLYPVASNQSPHVTKVSSQKRWLGIHPLEWAGDVHIALPVPDTSEPSSSTGKDAETTGVATFSTCEKLPASIGMWEARYHHDGKHTVLARSAPFEIYVPKASNPDDFAEVYENLGEIVRFSLQDNKELLPQSLLSSPSPVDGKSLPDKKLDDFQLESLKQAQLISHAIKQAFDVELSADVIAASANVQNLCEQILTARRLVLSAWDKVDTKEA